MRFWYLLITSVAFLLAGCAAPRPLLPAPYTVIVTADKALNPDRNGQPTPVQIRLFKLRSVNTFLSTDFFTLFEKADDALRSDLVSTEAFTLQPGEVKRFSATAGDDDRMIGIFVAYRDLEHAMWRAVAPLPSPKRAPRYAWATVKTEPALVKAAVGPNKVSITSHTTDATIAPAGRTPSHIPAPNAPDMPPMPDLPELPRAPTLPPAPPVPSKPSLPTLSNLPSMPGPTSLPPLAPVQAPPPLPSVPTLSVPPALPGRIGVPF